MTGSSGFAALTRARKGGETEIQPQPVIRHGEHLITEPLHSDTCRHCGAPILTATDIGLDYQCDPTPLTAIGELAAHLQGRLTVAIVTTPSYYEVRLRTAERIATHPDDTVVARHRCPTRSRGRQLFHDPDPQLLRRHVAVQEDTDDPPF